MVDLSGIFRDPQKIWYNHQSLGFWVSVSSSLSLNQTVVWNCLAGLESEEYPSQEKAVYGCYLRAFYSMIHQVFVASPDC